jgi:N-acetylneuraminate synthase/sialic acid synthase
MAAQAGVHAVKGQVRTNAALYTAARLASPYAHEHSYGATYGEHRAALELSEAGLVACQHQARAVGVPWFATAFDEAAVDRLMALEVPMLKVHSGGLTDRPLLDYVGKQGVPVLLSTGSGGMEDIDRAKDRLQHVPHALLHCTASYPLAADEANLRVISTLRARYPDTVIGFSSHAPGLLASLLAVALGARILEHHVTRSRAGKGTDHGFSLEAKGLQTLCEDARAVPVLLGDGMKRVYPSEAGPIAKMRRILTAGGWRIP